MTDPLVETTGSALSESAPTVARELQRTCQLGKGGRLARLRRFSQVSIEFGQIWVVLGNYFGQFWPITADPGPSGPQKSIPDGLRDLGTQNESSGAHLGPYF